jgi:HlyD family type I secretion membrane fusion protein
MTRRLLVRYRRLALRLVARLDRLGRLPPAEDGPPTRGPILAGCLILLLFFGALVGWAGTVPLASAALAPGVVAVAGFRKTVQHLEGGIVRELLVAEGDRVEADQLLLRLDDTRIKAELDALDAQLVAAAALEARLLAEQAQSERLVVPAWLEARAGEPVAGLALASQAELLRARGEALRGQQAILRQRIARQREQIAGLDGQMVAQARERAILQAELEGLRPLAARGVVAKSRLWSLERQEAQLEAAGAENRADAAAAEQAIGELELALGELQAQRAAEIAGELRQVQERRLALAGELAAKRDTFERTGVRAPIAGIVVDRRIHTPGGVLAAGSPVLDLVPVDAPLVIEARVDPKDRDVVAPGQEASVRFTAFSQRVASSVRARVQAISADRLVDAATGQGWYRALIELVEDPGPALGGARLHPGMQASVMIVTGERTALAYLARPILASVQQALRED